MQVLGGSARRRERGAAPGLSPGSGGPWAGQQNPVSTHTLPGVSAQSSPFRRTLATRGMISP